MRGSSEFSAHFSGWGLLQNVSLLIDVITFQIRNGGTNIPLIKKFKNKKALVNIKNNDEKCFLWCVLFHFFSKNVKKGKQDLAESYLPYKKVFQFENIKFPITTKDVTKFEKINLKHDISINVYTYLRGKFGILRIAKEEKTKHIDLLLLERADTFHYVYITNLSRLVRPQITKTKQTIHLCRKCFSHFY